MAEPTRDALARWITLRLLGALAVVAFASLAWQAEGLIGPDGLLPYQPWLDRVAEGLGDQAIWRLPTLAWWIPVEGLLWAGALASAAVMVGVPAEGPLLWVAWACYLSVSLVGQRFLSFQWDTLLLEALFTAALYARWHPWGAREPSRVATWLMRLLLVKLMWLSGAVKLASGDPTWWDGSAMAYHYETQPLPNPVSWYAHHLPAAFHQLETWATLAIELVLPLLVFAGRPGRAVAFGGFVALLCLLLLTGNYGFFQWLTLALCVPLLGDDVWRRVLPARLVALTERRGLPASEGYRRARRGVHLLIAVPIVGLGVVLGAQRLGAPALPEPLQQRVEATRAWRTVNSYGLFATMTRARPMVWIEVSDDGQSWSRWPYRFQPTAPEERPPVVPLHMPRLDWQLWFAALGSCRSDPWVGTLLQRLLDQEPSVVALMGPPPLAAPRYARARVAMFRFTQPGDEGWWVHRQAGAYCPTRQLHPTSGRR